MKTGDTIRFKHTDITGTITEVFSEHHFKVKFNVFGAPIIVRDSEIELVSAAPIVNPCICCGAETPEGRTVCGVCEKP